MACANCKKIDIVCTSYNKEPVDIVLEIIVHDNNILMCFNEKWYISNKRSYNTNTTVNYIMKKNSLPKNKYVAKLDDFNGTNLLMYIYNLKVQKQLDNNIPNLPEYYHRYVIINDSLHFRELGKDEYTNQYEQYIYPTDEYILK